MTGSYHHVKVETHLPLGYRGDSTFRDFSGASILCSQLSSRLSDLVLTADLIYVSRAILIGRIAPVGPASHTSCDSFVIL